MIIYNNDKKNVQIKLSDVINVSTVDRYYEIEVPVIRCSDKKDAEIIQTKLNSAMNEICHEIVKEK